MTTKFDSSRSLSRFATIATVSCSLTTAASADKTFNTQVWVSSVRVEKMFAGFLRSKSAFSIRESICNIVHKAMVSSMTESAGLLVEKCLCMLETVSTAILVVDVMALE